MLDDDDDDNDGNDDQSITDDLTDVEDHEQSMNETSNNSTSKNDQSVVETDDDNDDDNDDLTRYLAFKEFTLDILFFLEVCAYFLSFLNTCCNNILDQNNVTLNTTNNLIQFHSFVENH